MEKINFSNSKELINRFEGSEFKKTILHDSEVYMIKFPDPIREKVNDLSYKNNQYSEYLGCHILSSCGFDVQETLLGTYDVAGKQKTVVACKDFTQNGSRLIEFSKLANADVTSDRKFDSSIESIYRIIDNSDLLPNKNLVKEKFWDMFVGDTLIGNEDRHYNNWGFLETNGVISMSPIYDCGSSLGATYSDETVDDMMTDPAYFKNQQFNLKSVYSLDGKRIFYHQLYKSPPQELKEAILRVTPKIDLDKISEIIKSTSDLPASKVNFLIDSIKLRYEQIILPAYNKLEKAVDSTVKTEKIHEKSDNIKFEKYPGTWYVMSAENLHQKDYFLLDCNEYGTVSYYILVDKDKNVILDNILHVPINLELFDSIEDYIESFNDSDIENDKILFFIDEEKETISWLHYTPDSSFGGYFTKNELYFDDVIKAKEQANNTEEFFDVLFGSARAYLGDVGTIHFTSMKKQYHGSDYQLEGVSEATMNSLIDTVENHSVTRNKDTEFEM